MKPIYPTTLDDQSITIITTQILIIIIKYIIVIHQGIKIMDNAVNLGSRWSWARIWCTWACHLSKYSYLCCKYNYGQNE